MDVGGRQRAGTPTLNDNSLSQGISWNHKVILECYEFTWKQMPMVIKFKWTVFGSNPPPVMMCNAEEMSDPVTVNDNVAIWGLCIIELLWILTFDIQHSLIFFPQKSLTIINKLIQDGILVSVQKPLKQQIVHHRAIHFFCAAFVYNNKKPQNLVWISSVQYWSCMINLHLITVSQTLT